MTAPIRLDDFSVAAIAATVAELLRGEGTDADLIDVAEVARRFGLSRDYVYRHADELGAVRIGDGPRGRLRFDPMTVREKLTHPPSQVRQSRREVCRPVRMRSQVDLLPIKGEGS